MNSLKKFITTALLSSLAFVGGCTAKHIDPADRDTTGSYDGVWVVSVDAPKADRVPMPGNVVMHCSWEPYEFNLKVDEGRLLLEGYTRESVVSTEGNFRFDWDAGSVRMQSGVISGSANEIVGIYAGNLAGQEPGGKFTQYVASLGGNTCSADMSIRRKS
ncbi:MAG: hypothetical protein KTR32_24065 [Granulosicoccus sp.]|nr:hypothetical protein [Granulosicoccus sp.]